VKVFNTLLRSTVELNPSICHMLSRYLKEKQGLETTSLYYEGNLVGVRSDKSINAQKIKLSLDETEICFKTFNRDILENLNCYESDKTYSFLIKLSYGPVPAGKRRMEKIVWGNQIKGTKTFSQKKVYKNFHIYLERKLGVTQIENLDVCEISGFQLNDKYHHDKCFYVSFKGNISEKDIFDKTYLTGFGSHKSYGFGLVKVGDA